MIVVVMAFIPEENTSAASAPSNSATAFSATVFVGFPDRLCLLPVLVRFHHAPSTEPWTSVIAAGSVPVYPRLSAHCQQGKRLHRHSTCLYNQTPCLYPSIPNRAAHAAASFASERDERRGRALRICAGH